MSIIPLGTTVEDIQAAGEEHPSVLYEAPGLPEELEQPVFWVDERIFLTVMEWRTNVPKDGMHSADSYSAVDVSTLNTRRTPIHENMENTIVASGSSETPSAIEKSPLDFANENPTPLITERVRSEEGSSRHGAPSEQKSTLGGKYLAAMGLDVGSTLVKPATQETLSDAKSVSDPDPLSYVKPQPRPERDVAQSSRKTAPKIPTENVATAEAQDMFSVESPGLGKSTSVPSMVGSPGGIYQPGWGVTNNCRLDTSDACQDVYNMNLDRQVAMGSQLRLRFEQEVRLLKKAKAQIARRDQRIQVREEEIKKSDQEIKSLKTVETEVHGLRNQARNLETLLEAEVDMKKAAEAKNVGLAKELESLRAQFADLQVSNNQLSEQVSTIQTQVTGEEWIKAAFEEFKKYKDNRVSSRCAEMDALSIDFDEELYAHMLIVIAGRRWVIEHGLRLAVMKCAESMELRQVFANVVSAGIAKGMSEGLKHRIEDKKANLDLAAIEAYDPEADTKYVMALHALKDLNSSKLNIPVYPEVRDPKYPWSFKEEILLEDAIAANISRAEKKKKCRVVCRTHGVGFAHHARSDGVPISVPIVILLVDAATQTQIYEDEASPRLLRSKSLSPMYNLDWP
ncbi:hypothetical protein Tco_0958784 [Tanacetum coccineum]